MPCKTKANLLEGVTGIKKSKFIGCNTLEVQYEDGRKAIRYHYTDVITTYPDGNTVLTTGGWKTVTTKERLNSYTPLCVSSEKGVWYVYGDNLDKTPFEDEMVFDSEWNLISEVKEVDLKAINKVKRKIAKYIKLVDSLGEIPFPNAGDCWFCSMREVGSGKPLGDCSRDHSHLENHLDEGYLHGSVIFNALSEYGYDNPAFLIQMNAKFQVKQALRRYYTKRLLPEIQAC